MKHQIGQLILLVAASLPGATLAQYSNAFPAVFDAAQRARGEAVDITCVSGGDGCGDDAGTLDDINGDGIADFAVTASGTDGFLGPVRIFKGGQIYVLFGNENLEQARALSVLDLNGRNGFTIQSDGAFSDLGEAAGVGDINLDGFPDIFASADGFSCRERQNAGKLPVIYGGPGAARTHSDVPADQVPGRSGQHYRHAARARSQF